MKIGNLLLFIFLLHCIFVSYKEKEEIKVDQKLNNRYFMKLYVKKIIILLFLGGAFFIVAQVSYWQQSVHYQMDIDFNAETHRFTGKQRLIYNNNSPDTLYSVFYHLYFNAFRPGSMMDVRNLNLEDADKRVGDRISKLKEDETGFQKVLSLKQDDKDVEYKVEGTILEVNLALPILPGASSTFQMNFEGQVPIQIRRSGRDSKEGIDYSMAQWYPKMAEYDEEGWHTHPYVGREFYAPWGDFEVNITIDKNYIIGATGILQNPNEIGYGYEKEGVEVKRKGKRLTWKFIAKNVHDFVWGADPDYTQVVAQVPEGPLLRFFYQDNLKTKAWEQLPEFTIKAFEFIEKNYGEYPYEQYAIIQGGDGGMEYPMATLITGERELKSLVGVTVHEALHSWYQGVLGSNESYYAWMDEGFTTYASAETMSRLFKNDNRSQKENYQGYIFLAKSGKEEPLSTHADHFTTNFAYGLGSYRKGAVALAQMNYIIGEERTATALLRYYDTWKFKHPDAKDWVRVFEKISGMELSWYLDYFINTTHTIDYAIAEVKNLDRQTQINLERIGNMPMPIDLFVTFADGSKKVYYAPLSIMRGEKKNETKYEREIVSDWAWTHPTYSITIEKPISDIVHIEIDESQWMADIDRGNNVWEP